MGSQAQPNHGLLVGAIVHLLNLIKMDAREAEESNTLLLANELWKVGAYVCVLTAASLCNHERFYLDLAGIRKHIDKGRTGYIPPSIDKHTILTEEMCKDLPHVTVCLLGKFKGKTGVDHHLITMANKAISGLHPRWWMEKLIEVCQTEGRFEGPAFVSADSTLASSPDYNAMSRRYPKMVQEETDLIPGDHDVDAFIQRSECPGRPRQQE
jgi:hypothetical protein